MNTVVLSLETRLPHARVWFWDYLAPWDLGMRVESCSLRPMVNVCILVYIHGNHHLSVVSIVFATVLCTLSTSLQHHFCLSPSHTHVHMSSLHTHPIPHTRAHMHTYTHMLFPAHMQHMLKTPCLVPPTSPSLSLTSPVHVGRLQHDSWPTFRVIIQ